jgi:hypothetical protein
MSRTSEPVDDAQAASKYPQLGIYGSGGALRHTIDCIPTTRPGVYLVNEPIDAADGEAVVVAFDGAVLRQVRSFADLRAAH